MPNWVYNALTIPVKDKDDAVAIMSRLADAESALSFMKIAPRPAQEEDNWYDWNIKNWGCKWDANDASVEDFIDESLTYRFNTAWSPPMPLVEKLSALLPDRRIELTFEEEQGWGGVVSLIDAKLTVEKQWDIPNSHEDIVKRQGECMCVGNDEPYYDDCYFFRAKEIEGLTPANLEAVKALGVDWHGTFDQLIEAVKVL